MLHHIWPIRHVFLYRPRRNRFLQWKQAFGHFATKINEDRSYSSEHRRNIWENKQMKRRYSITTKIQHYVLSCETDTNTKTRYRLKTCFEQLTFICDEASKRAIDKRSSSKNILAFRHAHKLQPAKSWGLSHKSEKRTESISRVWHVLQEESERRGVKKQ